MSIKGASVLLTAVLLHWCQVPTMPAPAAKAPAGSHNMKVRTIPRMQSVEHCKDKKHSFIMRNFSSHLEKDGMERYDTNFEITKAARRLVAFKMILHRCPLGVGGECEYFNTFSWDVAVCNLVTSSGMMWTPVVNNVHPAFKCPVQKGPYKGRNMTVDLTSFGKVIEGLNIEKYTWPIEAQLSSEDGLYICMKIIGEARRVKVKET